MLHFSSHSLLKIIIFVLSLSGFSTLIRAEPFETIINNGGSQNRLDIAVMGDGYTAAEMDKYRADVQNFMNGIFAQEPYREYQRYFNVQRIDVVSNQSGADHSERNPPVYGDTALDAEYNCGGLVRLICINQVKVYSIIFRTLSASQYDVILVLVNDPQSGGMGGQVAVASAARTDSIETVLHELGHSFAFLADEYTDSGNNCNFSFEPNEVNATQETNRSAIKWNHWINPTTSIPTIPTIFSDAGIVGLYLGARHCETGFYRPTFNSKMRSMFRPFEQVNTEQHVKRLYNFVSPIDDSSPAGNTLSLNNNQSQTFTVKIPKPFTHTLNVRWLVDGRQMDSGTSFTLISQTLSPGNHTVNAEVSDPTSFVRSDPQQILIENRYWTVKINAATQPTLFDYDGDGKSDISVFRRSNGFWYVLKSSGGFSYVQFGQEYDTPVPGDYDGDGKTDIAVYRIGRHPLGGVEDNYWYILRSLDNTFLAKPLGVDNGATFDEPVPADYDGDGKTDLAIYTSQDFIPSPIYFTVLQSSTNTKVITEFGLNSDQLVPADYDGDGRADYAVYREGIWYILQSSNGALRIERFGQTGDQIVPGDFDRDGKADLAVWRPSSGVWYYIKSSDGAFKGSFTSVQFGANGDKPVPADYDGDGKTDIAVFRPANGVWYLLQSTKGFAAQQFGLGDDEPIPNTFVRQIY